MSEDVEELFTRARALQTAGRDDEAKAAYVELLGRDAAHLGALTNLGALLESGNYRSAALVTYRQAAAAHPQVAAARVNYANALFYTRDYDAARREYEAALALEPGSPPAHQGLSLALDRSGDAAGARRHRDAGFGGQPIVEVPFRGSAPEARTLVLLGTRGGNVHVERFLDDRVFAVTKLFPEYYDGDLPPHDFAFNAIGDAELGAEALAAARRALARTRARVLNAPDAVARTGRAENARRLAGIPGVVAARTIDYPRERLARRLGAEALASDGFTFPMLLRSPGFHTGLHFVKIDGAGGVAGAVDALPGGTLTAIEFLDARGSDGLTRKYRVVIVDGRIYPLHLAIADDWKVHYFSAAMGEHGDRRTEDARFLTDMRGAIGEPAVAALEGIAASLGLDFAGIDFGLDSAGNVLLFEANATMFVPASSGDPKFAYRAGALQRIEQAVGAMLRGA